MFHMVSICIHFFRRQLLGHIHLHGANLIPEAHAGIIRLLCTAFFRQTCLFHVNVKLKANALILNHKHQPTDPSYPMIPLFYGPLILLCVFPLNCRHLSIYIHMECPLTKGLTGSPTCFFFNLNICCSTFAISLSTRSILWISSSFDSLEGDVSCSSPMCSTGPPGEWDSTLTVN